MTRHAAAPVLDGSALIATIPAGEAFGFMVRLAYLGLRGMLHDELAAHRLTSGVWYYLWALWEEDGINQRELSERVRIKEASTTVTLRTMERRGLIRRLRNDDDRRSVKIFLTDAGRALQDRVMPIAVRSNQRALDGFSAADVIQMHAYMKRVIDNLGAYATGAAE
jgi:DNA-binding MarR family transcriptional regulator